MGDLSTRLVRALSLLVLVVVLASAAASAAAGASDPGRVKRVGRWLVDGEGRVVVLHGFNVVQKNPPFVRTEFGAKDARRLAREGFIVARLPFLWEGVEPEPGKYDDKYIARVLKVDSLMSRYGIRTLVGFHQDLWSRTALAALGDGAPAWATLGSGFNDSFAAFWRNDPGPGGVGIQTRFLRAWRHVARKLSDRPNIIGIDPFNEPYPGSDYPPPCGPFSRCVQFDSKALPAFYRRAIAAIRAGGATQVILPEGVAESGFQAPVLPKFADPQTAFNFHYYCSGTQTSTLVVPVGTPSPEAKACKPIERTNIGRFTGYGKQLGVPAILTEFSCNDVNPDNAQVVDLVARSFITWTAWAYYPRNQGSDCPGQGLIRKDDDPASAKQDKLGALAVPYARAIAGRPKSTKLDRASRTYTLRYRSAPVSGARLKRGARTEIFVPKRTYPDGYVPRVGGATVDSRPNARRLLLTANGNTLVWVKIKPRG